MYRSYGCQCTRVRDALPQRPRGLPSRRRRHPRVRLPPRVAFHLDEARRRVAPGQRRSPKAGPDAEVAHDPQAALRRRAARAVVVLRQAPALAVYEVQRGVPRVVSRDDRPAIKIREVRGRFRCERHHGGLQRRREVRGLRQRVLLRGAGLIVVGDVLRRLPVRHAVPPLPEVYLYVLCAQRRGVRRVQAGRVAI